MPVFGWSRDGAARTVRDAGARPRPEDGAPRDVEALIQVIEAVEGAPDLRTALERASRALVTSTQLSYGAGWMPDPTGSLRLTYEDGEVAAQLSGVAQPTRPLLRAVAEKQTIYVDDLADEPSDPRAARALGLGMHSALYFPFTSDGRVIAVLEVFSAHRMGVDTGRLDKLRGIGRVADLAIAHVLAQAQLQQVADDRLAVTQVVGELARARDDADAARIALETVREAFGWAYGSYWQLQDDNLLHFEIESGSAGTEFRKVTLAATFAEGVGLSGRAWKARDLVFVPDLADLTDCVRAPSAGRAGVRSGICFPIMVGDRVIGTMDFFQTQTIELSQSRASALRNVQQLVSQRIETLRRNAIEEVNARALLETVSQLREVATDAQQVANEAVHRAGAMTGEVGDLGNASSAIGDVIKIISSIADQTNLLALNATIEAARAGDVGKGFAVVASEVKELARETAQATSQVADQIQAIQTNTRSVSDGIHATSEIIGRMDSVQARINDVLETQAGVAARLERA